MLKIKQLFEKTKKEKTLHRRLLLFFIVTTAFLILAFAILLALFGITGHGEKAIREHLSVELSGISQAINDEFGRISLGGINIAEEIAKRSDSFFEENNISAAQLQAHPELIEPLLAEQIDPLLTTVNTRYCGGAFVLLDATISPDGQDAANHKAGIFIKKTQPTSTNSLGVQLHYLRGPAQIARDNGIMLLGQWRMEYDISGQDFFTQVMETARANPDLPLSRLYYWSGRVVLKGNSEAGFLLCVPLRSEDGTVFGLCGIEVSDRMFKNLYTPEGGSYENIFTVMAPGCENGLATSKGLIAGNYYLTGTRWECDLEITETHENFTHYTAETGSYGGQTAQLRLYPSGSAYEADCWSAAVLMPQSILHSAVNGSVYTFIYIIIGILVVSMVASVFISRRYLRPVTQALDSIKTTHHSERKPVPYTEINDLFEYLAAKDREQENTVQQMLGQQEQAQLELSRLAYSRKQEVDPELYQQFLEHLHTLTPTERTVFDLYISGKSAKEIMEIMGIKENTLKYHNKNIYSKLGVSSRKELLRYAALMSQDKKGESQI